MSLSSIYKFHANNALGYMNEVFSHAEPLKTSDSLNAFKHNLKDYYFRKGNKKSEK